MCCQRLARVLLFGCLLAVLVGGAPLLRPAAAHAIEASPALGQAAPLSSPLSSRNHDGDDGDKDKGDKCSVTVLNCDVLQQQQECIVPHKVVQVVPVPVVKVVKVVQVVEKKVFVPVPVEKKVFVPVPVEKVVKVFVPVPVVVTPTPAVKVFVPVPVPVTPTPVVKVIVLPPATPTPMGMPMPPGDPMF